MRGAKQGHCVPSCEHICEPHNVLGGSLLSTILAFQLRWACCDHEGGRNLRFIGIQYRVAGKVGSLDR